MASSPNVDGMVDIRSFAIFQDVSVSQSECFTAAEIIARGPFYRRLTHAIMINLNEDNERIGPVTGPYVFRSPEEVNAQVLSEAAKVEQAHHPEEPRPLSRKPFFAVEEEEIDPKPELSKYDNAYSWTCCYCSFAIVLVVFGTIFSYGALLLQIRLIYNLSYTETVLTGAACFAIFVLVGPITTCVIKSLGYRSTAIFGLLMLFLGLVLEGFITHVIVFFISRLVLIPIGGGFAHTASHYMSSFFEQQIMYAVLLLCSSSVLGVLTYSCAAIMLQSIMGYKGIQVVFGLVVLFIISVTHVFPTKMTKPETEERAGHQQLKECIKSNIREDIMTRAGKDMPKYDEDGNVELKSYLCVCVCEMKPNCDQGYFLWAGITMIASLTVAVPYLFMYLFYFRLNFLTLVPYSHLKLFLYFSLSNLFGRVFLIFYNNHFFSFNRMAFQLSLAGTAWMMILVSHVETYGWLASWMSSMGFFQGILSIAIPRITLQAVQRDWLKRAWVLIIIADSIGSFIGPLILTTLRDLHFPVEFKMPSILIGILQLVAVFLAYLVPNDESNYKDIPPPGLDLQDDDPTRLYVIPPMPPTSPSPGDWPTRDIEVSEARAFPRSPTRLTDIFNPQIPTTFGRPTGRGGERCPCRTGFHFQNVHLNSVWRRRSISECDLRSWNHSDESLA